MQNNQKVADVVIVKGEDNRNMRKLAKIDRLITGRDGVVRGVKVKTGKGRLKRRLK